MGLGNSTEVDCNAAVEQWKDGYRNFSGPPSPRSKAGDLYNNLDTLSFIALYNPGSGSAKPTADCRVATCTKTDEDKVTTASIFFCFTTPDVLKADNTPFS